MINNRNKSVVRDMKWTADGQKICIVYEDGAVIVGSVDGNRLWGKELSEGLSSVEWSPDARYILFVTAESEVHVYDMLGSKIKAITLKDGLKEPLDGGGDPANIIGIHWYDGTEGLAHENTPTLAIATDTGKVQIMCGTEDSNPLLLETYLRLTQSRWNTRGTVLALAGTQVGAGARCVRVGGCVCECAGL